MFKVIRMMRTRKEILNTETSDKTQFVPTWIIEQIKRDEKQTMNLKTIKDNKKLLCPKAGTATSSPSVRTASLKFQVCDIPNVLWWMEKS
jgi:hypothetical protein